MMLGGFAMVFFGLLVLVGLFLLGLVLVRGVRSESAGTAPDGHLPQAFPSARQTLDERYARGELSTEEYQERLRALRAGE